MKRVFLICVILVFSGEMAPLARAANVVPNEIQQPGTQQLEVPTLIPAVQNKPGPHEDNTLNRACYDCHAYDRQESIVRIWSGSMMAQSSRDPLFWACLAIAEQDFGGAGDLCIRCHSTRGWYDGRSIPTDGSAIGIDDADGVVCEFCHKMTNPDGSEHRGVMNPPFKANDGIEGYYGSGIASLSNGVARLGPYDPMKLYAVHVRRPIPDDPKKKFASAHPVKKSTFHRDVDFCGTCHDVSNPAVGDLAPNNGAQVPLEPGTFSGILGTPVDLKAAFNNPPYKYGIVERTYSEYKAGLLSQTLVSDYSTLPAELQAGAIQRSYDSAQRAGKGGNYADGTPRYFSCQSCHLPPVIGQGNNISGTRRTDLPLHDMTGGSYWIPSALKYLYSRGKLRFSDGLKDFQIQSWAEGAARAKVVLENAASLSVNGNVLKVVNLTGHKLITGYPEGRRMWLNIKWFDAGGNLLREDGAYGPLIDSSGTRVMVRNPANGQMVQVESIRDLHDPNTRIYESNPGISQGWAAKLISINQAHYEPMILSYDRYTGAPGPAMGQLAKGELGPHKKTFHFVLNNKLTSDNRIPPYGMSYDECKKRNCLPVPAGQYGSPETGGTYNYWDEITLNPPAGADSATINLLFQSASWEYIQFLYLANDGSVPFLANEGMTMLEAWLNTGMSYPYVMASAAWGDATTPAPAPAPSPEPRVQQCSYYTDKDSCEDAKGCEWDKKRDVCKED
jgi:hypothetical protein